MTTTKITFLIDDLDSGDKADEVMDGISRLGGYNVEEEMAEAPTILPHERQRKPKP